MAETNRRRVAILSTEVVGTAKLMVEDEQAMAATCEKYRVG